MENYKLISIHIMRSIRSSYWAPFTSGFHDYFYLSSQYYEEHTLAKSNLMDLFSKKVAFGCLGTQLFITKFVSKLCYFNNFMLNLDHSKV